MARFSKEKDKRVKRNLDQAFEAVKELIKHPEQIEAMPDESIIIPVETPPKKRK